MFNPRINPSQLNCQLQTTYCPLGVDWEAKVQERARETDREEKNCKQYIRLTFTVDLKLHGVVSKLTIDTPHIILIPTYVHFKYKCRVRTRSNWHIEFISVSCLFMFFNPRLIFLWGTTSYVKFRNMTTQKFATYIEARTANVWDLYVVRITGTCCSVHHFTEALNRFSFFFLYLPQVAIYSTSSTRGFLKVPACSVLGKNRASFPIEIHSDRELDARNLRRKRKKRNELTCLTASLINKRIHQLPTPPPAAMQIAFIFVPPNASMWHNDRTVRKDFILIHHMILKIAIGRKLTRMLMLGTTFYKFAFPSQHRSSQSNRVQQNVIYCRSFRALLQRDS